MSANPFIADGAVPLRSAKIDAAARAALRDDALACLSHRSAALPANADGVISAADGQTLIERYGLASVRDLMLLLLDVAQRFAAPPISGFLVGAVGLEAETGALILGGNVEFPGTYLGSTVHGEGFVATRAMSRCTTLGVIAIGEAHPCAHCRQYLSEFQASDRLELIDPLGHTLTLAQLYPWPFDPAYLGQAGAVPGRTSFPDLAFVARTDHPHADRLLAAGCRAHAPYSRCPGAVVLGLSDGGTVTGASIESVAFNPTLPPLQAAIVHLLAHGYGYGDITSATLGTVKDGAVEYAASTTELLGRIAPGITLDRLGWRTSATATLGRKRRPASIAPR